MKSSWRNEPPKVAVVVPTLESRWLLTRRLLLSLIRQSYRDFEVIIVDSNPVGRDIETLASSRVWQFPVRYVRYEADGINIGDAYATGCASVGHDAEVVINVHGEIVFQPNTIAEMVGLLEVKHDPPVGGVQLFPEQLMDNKSLTDRTTIFEMEKVDDFLLESLAREGDLRWVDVSERQHIPGYVQGESAYETWPGDPFPRYWCNHFRHDYLTRVGTLDRTRWGNFQWAELKRMQYARGRQLLEFNGTWNACFAFRPEFVLDMKHVWFSYPFNGFMHEGFKGWKQPVTVLFATKTSVLHQRHLSEPSYVTTKVYPHYRRLRAKWTPEYDIPIEEYRAEVQWKSQWIEANGAREEDIVLDLGCANCPEGIGIDIHPFPEAEILWDVEECIPFPAGSVARVRANHFLEHVNPVKVMNEIYRVLREEGELHLNVPRVPHLNAWVDPTHTSWWSPETLEYYRKPVPQYGIHTNFELVKVDDEGAGVRAILVAKK